MQSLSVGHFSHLNPLICTDMQTFARIWREPRLGLSGVGELHTHMCRSLDRWHYIDAGNPAPQLHYDNHNSSGYLGNVRSNTNRYHSGLLNVLCIGM